MAYYHIVPTPDRHYCRWDRVALATAVAAGLYLQREREIP
jgi:hypothetical protein